MDSGAPLLEALHLMVKWGVHRIPVVDSDGELITILSQSQVTSHMYPSFLLYVMYDTFIHVPIYRYLWCFDALLLKKTASSLASGITDHDSPSEASSDWKGGK